MPRLYPRSLSPIRLTYNIDFEFLEDKYIIIFYLYYELVEARMLVVGEDVWGAVRLV